MKTRVIKLYSLNINEQLFQGTAWEGSKSGVGKYPTKNITQLNCN